MALPEGGGATSGSVAPASSPYYGIVTKSLPGTTVTATKSSLPGTYGKKVPGTKPGLANSSNPQSPANVEGLAGSQLVQALAAGGAPDQMPKFDIINKPLHPKSETNFTYGMDAVKLQRGMIERIADRATLQGDGKPLPQNKRYKFRFLYNPESVSISTAPDFGLVPPDLSTSSGLVVGKFPGQETWRFGLMLDRTQEAYEQGISTLGTQHDIDALYRVINGNYGNPGFLYLSAVRVYWGVTTKQSKPLPPFNGYITALNITHTKFTPRMCPIRTLVDLSITRIVGDQGPGSAQTPIGTGSAA